MKRIACYIVIAILLAGCGSREGSSEKSKEGAALEKKDLMAEGRHYLLTGDYARAIEAFKAQTLQNPQDSKAYFIMGQTYMHIGDCQSAIESFKTVTALDPNNGPAYLLLGGCHDLKGNKDEAIANVGKSIVIFDKNKDVKNFKRSVVILRSLTKSKESEESEVQ